MSAPLSEVSRSILEIMAAACAAAKAASQQAALTWRDIAARMPHINADSVRRSFENLLRAGRLARVGPVKVPGSRRPMLACSLAQSSQASLDLQAVMSSWMGGAA